MEKVGTMLIDAIDAFLAAKAPDNRRKRCFHPSSLDKSPAALYKHYLGGDSFSLADPRFKRICDNGHGVHDRLQGYLFGSGLLMGAEVPVWDEKLEIYGNCDGIIEHNGIRGVLEIKSINSRGFEGLSGPKRPHLIQVHAYMYCLDLDRAALLYECKDDQRLKEFLVPFNPKLWQSIVDKIQLVQSCIRAGTPPEATGETLDDAVCAAVDLVMEAF